MPERSIVSSEIERLETSDDISDKTIYEPLPAGEFIRVLKLQPGDTDHDIKCSLEIVDLEQSKGSYEAISYVWGDPNDTIDVQCNGQRVPITLSLADALRNFRHTSEPRLLWVDALCINQEDKKEKGHQVKRMGEVYANAKRTLVWLGCDDQNIAKDAFALILEANAYFADSFLQANQRTSMMAPFVKPYPISMDRERWLGVASLFKFPWFRRVWTVQESAIAEECHVYWGSASIDIADVLEICVWLSQRQDFKGTICNVVRNFNYLGPRNIGTYLRYKAHRPKRWQQSRIGLAYLATKSENSTFMMVLQASRYLKASDPRDHVYAFLGCPAAIDSTGRTFVEADYTSSIDDLNLRLAYASMKNAAEGPFFLSAVRHNSRDRLLDGVHPSWLPVWHVAGEYCRDIANPTFWFQAGGIRKLFTATENGERRLSIGACTFDTVIWRSSTIQKDRADLTPTYVSTSGLHGVFIDTLWDDVMRSSSQLGITVQYADFFRSLMIGYPINDGFSSISDEEQQRMIDAYRKRTSVAGRGNQEAVMDVVERRDATWVKGILYNIHNASMFLTRGGRIGIAPLGHLVEVGDVCCIVFGATVPFLLTPVREGRHKLISECYINGVMNGEIMQQFAGSDDLSEHCIVLE
ncbi:hypothetical protein J4E93_010159 [Alternaria ventricosa]|uniref:uncharacterized protein n=1 Tax=Alternaria ventricosa TaxID=1187951 RepID=UPI0020C3E6E6|nr:uncharacterized protein J4E93_010159 [Alternaria ventricosa]KAI4638359.1 hypothetical protein J4E93_010159 [Alternaria ventricosa]